MSITYLKIKIVSLADEAKTIRREELKLIEVKRGPSMTRLGLYLHRVNDVRGESRSALLAYGFLRQMSYKRIEAKCYSKPNFKRISELVKKYGEFDKPSLEAWLADPVDTTKAAA